MILDVSESNFEKEVLNSKVPVVVDFWAAWCTPCRIFSPIIEEVSKEYGNKVKFCKLNADENESVASTYSIMSIPTTLLFEDGEVKAMSVGVITKEALKLWIDKNL
jgi:thioredoxin 1